jgi:hypothetical protein
MSRGNINTGVPVPLCIYCATASLCWFTPSSLAAGDNTFIVNATPTNALALVAVALAVAHAALRLQGRLVVVVAGLWASATIWIATAFAVAVYEPKRSTWAVVTLLGTLSVGSSACALVVLAWQIARRRLATGAQFISRSAVVLV